MACGPNTFAACFAGNTSLPSPQADFFIASAYAVPSIDSPETRPMVPAGTAEGDTTLRNVSPALPVYRPKGTSLITPAVFFGYGVLALRNGALQDINTAVWRGLWENHPHRVDRAIEDYLLFAPVALVYGANIAGLKSRNNFVDRSILFLLSGGLALGVSASIKKFELEERPDGSNLQSFPSGHTTTAFASAEYARLEYRGISPWPGIVAYGCAATAAFFRMYNNHHWFSDVVAGAGIGIFSARLAYYVYPAIRKRLFGTRVAETSVHLSPTWQGPGRYGLVFQYHFK